MTADHLLLADEPDSLGDTVRYISLDADEGAGGCNNFEGFLIRSRSYRVTVTFLLSAVLVIFGFSQFVPKLKAVPKSVQSKGNGEASAAQLPGDFEHRAKVYDLAHERRLRALHGYMEQGYSLSEAARLLGVSTLTVCRWNDHGRR